MYRWLILLMMCFSQAPEGFPDVLRTFRIPKKVPPLEVAKVGESSETSRKDERQERGICERRLLSGLPTNPHIVEFELRNSDGCCWKGTDLRGQLQGSIILLFRII